MKTIKTVVLVILTATLFFSCDNDNDPTNNVCEDTYVSQAITDAFSVANGYEDLVIVDFQRHEYDIVINADGEICTIGYQNPGPDVPWLGYTGDYTMEVINNTSGASYSGTHTFSQTVLDYQAITPVIVASGDIITVRRTSPSAGSFEATRGRVLHLTGAYVIPYPITQGNVEFLSSRFQDLGSGVYSNNNTVQPYIALGFKVD